MKSLVVALTVFSFALPTGANAAAVAARCDAEYGAVTETLSVSPARDVFTSASVRLGDRFQFRAQYLEERAKLKTWVYELREHAPALIHASEHALSPQSCAQPPRDFGLNKVYSSDLEREMFFHCFTVCE